MLNQVILVGRIAKINEKEKNNIVTLAVQKSYKNNNGEYNTDFIPCLIYGNVANNVKEYCQIGDMIGIKGNIETDENKNTIVKADRVTFLTSKAYTKDTEEN